jgi:hypothetical protein
MSSGISGYRRHPAIAPHCRASKYLRLNLTRDVSLDRAGLRAQLAHRCFMLRTLSRQPRKTCRYDENNA